ncbi:hypothetical protein ACROYT_G009096 [Oculina patagonica]
MPPILATGLRRRKTWKEYFYDALQVVHFLLAMGFLWAGFVEFIRNPPYFDAYGDASTLNDLPEGLFETDPRNIDREQSLRLMDLPILFMLCAYFIVCWWLKFQGLAWILTACIMLVLLCFFVVNFWAVDLFDWRYYRPRMKGLETQVFTISLSITTTFIVLFYKRKKMPFKFKATLPIKPFGKIHVFCNFAAIFVIVYFCLIMWFSKLYVSWSCFKNYKEVLLLCQSTDMVQCYPCDSCEPGGLKQCVRENATHTLFHCQDVNKDQGAFCLFNYNLSVFVFLTVFAYVGGLVVFLSKVFTIVLHYTFRAFFLFMKWCRIKFGAREGHRASMDLPYMQDHSHVIIQEPFQYVDRTNPNESEVTDDNCHLNSSIDTCHIEEGDAFVDAIVS